MKVVLWNIAWRLPSRPRGMLIQSIIDRENPDLVCLLEGHVGFLRDGHEIASDPDYGAGPQRTRRKVLLWSRNAWTNVECLGTPNMPPGRLVCAATSTQLGSVEVIGVCVPWSMAGVANGMARWELHRRYLNGLKTLVSEKRAGSTLLLGDFNQTIAASRAPRDAADTLATVFGAGFAVATPPGDTLSIDHCAIRGDLRLVERRLLDNAGSDGR